MPPSLRTCCSLAHTMYAFGQIFDIRGIAYTWILSYFTNRSQYVHYGNYDSEVLAVSCGVPQYSFRTDVVYFVHQ